MDPEDGARLARNLDWNLLRTFIAIVQEGGITAAANRLLLKQPTVSNALRRLENQLGKKLIERSPGKFVVTAVGTLLYRESLDMYGTISRLAVVMRDVPEEIRGNVKIGLASHVMFPAFDNTLTAISERHPKVSYAIDVSTSADTMRSVLEKRASFGICLVHERHPKLAYEKLFREHFGFFCGPRHRFFGRADVELADLEGEPSVSFRTDALQDALRSIAMLRAEARLDDTIRGISSHLEEVKRMIIAGVGIGPLPIHVVTRDTRDGLLWQLPPYETPPAIDIYLVWNPATRFNRAEQVFLEMLRQHVAEIPVEQRTYPQILSRPTAPPTKPHGARKRSPTPP